MVRCPMLVRVRVRDGIVVSFREKLFCPPNAVNRELCTSPVGRGVTVEK